MNMNVMIYDILHYLFTLVEGHLTENICKVFCVANIVGLAFSLASLEGPYTARAAIAALVLALFACFFGSMLMFYREVAYEEDIDNL